MTLPNETIEKALRMLGWPDAHFHVSPMGRYSGWVDGHGSDISLDLASLLKRCKDTGIPTLHDEGPTGDFMFSVMDANGVWHDAASTDPTDALFLALAAAWDATQKDQ